MLPCYIACWAKPIEEWRLEQVAKPAGAAERAPQPAPQQLQHAWRQRSSSKRWQPPAESGGWSQSLLPVYSISVVAARAMCKYKVGSPLCADATPADDATVSYIINTNTTTTTNILQGQLLDVYKPWHPACLTTPMLSEHCTP